MNRSEMNKIVSYNVADLYQRILEQPELIGERDPEGNSLLEVALDQRAEDTALVLIENGSDVNSTDNMGVTPLHTAVFWGLKHAVWELLDKGANPNAQDYTGRTALHRIPITKDDHVLECAFILLDHRADPNLQDREGKTPLHLALSVAFARILVEHGASMDVLDNGGKTPYQNHSHLVLVADYLYSIGAR